MRKTLDSFFPSFGVKNVRIYYLLTIAMAAFFFEGNWIYFWTMFMNYGQLGILDAAGFAFGFLMEIPTGAVADLLGKKATIILGMLSGIIGGAFMAFANQYIHFFIGFLLAHLFWALYSGAAEALVFDSLKENGKEENYDKVISSGIFLYFIVFTISIILGGLMYQFHFRLPSIAWMTTNIFGLIFAAFLIEPKIDTEVFSFKNYRRQLSVGFRSLLTHPLKKYFILFFVLAGSGYLYDWGLIKPILGVNFGYDSFWLAVVLASISVLSGLVVKFLPQIKKLTGDFRGLLIIGALLTFGFGLSSIQLRAWGFIPMLILGLSSALVYPWITIIVNKSTESKYRATTLSTVALISKLPYVLIAVAAGNAAQSNNLGGFMVLLMIVVLLGTLSGLWFYRKNVKAEIISQ